MSVEHHADTAHTRDVPIGLRRRRDTAYRLPPLDCGQHRDPWLCRCHDGPPSDRELDAYADAAQHLMEQGLTPAPNPVAMRRMWRRGGDDLRRAVQIAERWELAA